MFDWILTMRVVQWFCTVWPIRLLTGGWVVIRENDTRIVYRCAYPHTTDGDGLGSTPPDRGLLSKRRAWKKHAIYRVEGEGPCYVSYKTYKGRTLIHLGRPLFPGQEFSLRIGRESMEVCLVMLRSVKADGCRLAFQGYAWENDMRLNWRKYADVIRL